MAHPRRAEYAPGSASNDASYWLRRCHGFQVTSPGARLGTVEDVLYGAELERPAALLVRTGLFIHRLEAIPVEDIKAIDPQAQRLSVRPRGDTST